MAAGNIISQDPAGGTAGRPWNRRQFDRVDRHHQSHRLDLDCRRTGDADYTCRPGAGLYCDRRLQRRHEPEFDRALSAGRAPRQLSRRYRRLASPKVWRMAARRSRRAPTASPAAQPSPCGRASPTARCPMRRSLRQPTMLRSPVRWMSSATRRMPISSNTDWNTRRQAKRHLLF